MNNSFSNLQALVDLAKEKSSEKRRKLLREVTDLFLENPEIYSAGELASFDDTLCSITDEVNVEERVELAARMSDNHHAPRKLIGKLAHDVISVAEPVLEHSPALTDEDLLSVINRTGQQHMRSITKRRSISAKISDAIVENGDDPVVADLLRNEGAETTRQTLEKVVVRAVSSKILQEPAVMRKDMPLDLLSDMFFSVDQSCKQTILDKTGAATNEEIEELEKQWSTGQGNQPAPSHALSQAQNFILEKEKSGELTEHFLTDLLEQGRHKEFLHGFACIAELDISAAKRIVSDPPFESLAVACKACGFERSTYSTIVLLLDDGKRLATDEMLMLLDLYDELEGETANRTMRFWRIRKAAMTTAGTSSSADAA